MRDWTNEQFKAAGWNWVLRDPESGRAIACTVSASDAGQWMNEGLRTVIALDHIKEREK